MTQPDDPPAVREPSGSVSTSRSLLVRLRDNESAAWDQLVDLYAPLVFHWCRRLDVPEQDIVDIFQDVFQSIAKSIGKFRRDRPGDTFRGWMRTITRNKVYGHFCKSGRQPDAVGGTDAFHRLSQFPDSLADLEESEDDQPHHELFMRALNVIKEDFAEHTWQAFWQVVVEGKTPTQVGEELSMRPGTVRVAKSRTLAGPATNTTITFMSD